MASDKPPVVFDDDNPEWTAADFARARPLSDFPDLAKAFPNGSRPVGRPKGSVTSNKSQVTLRLDNDVIAAFKAGGAGWQSRINDALRKAVS